MSEPVVQILVPATPEVLALIERILPHGAPTPADEWVDANEISRRFGFSAQYWREHAEEVGAVRTGKTGEGRKPRMLFNPERVRETLVRRDETIAPASTPSRQRAPRTQPKADLLPVKERAAKRK